MSATEPTDTGLIDVGGGGMFRALGVYNFRVWFFGSLTSSMGAWMQATAMGWVVLTELTDGDAAAMGVAIMLQAAPGLLLIPVVGRVVDRFERRTMLAITSSLFSALALALGILLVLDVLVLPSLFGEGLPMVVLEAMAAGVPVAATRVEGVPEAIRDGIDGVLAEPGNAQDLAAAIRRIVDGELDWQQLRHNARQRHAERFSDEAMAAQLATVYREILDK